jgi:hypothetical protein
LAQAKDEKKRTMIIERKASNLSFLTFQKKRKPFVVKNNDWVLFSKTLILLEVKYK